MMQVTARGSLILGLLALLFWAGHAQAVPCQNNIPASNPDAVYIDHGDGTVTDTRTDLMWKQCAEGLSGTNCQIGSAQNFTWADALARAKASTFANYADWRLPNVKELSSLVEECRWAPSINTNRFPNTPSEPFWSGSPNASSPKVWLVVNFDVGQVGRLFGSFSRVRLVRGGQ